LLEHRNENFDYRCKYRNWFATAEQLVKQGQHVILACRNPQKAQAAQEKLRALDQAQVDFISLI
jgi:NAD(P)-dependent dehydrogenase (short-subunit alcohol dehydrogenase family)